MNEFRDTPVVCRLSNAELREREATLLAQFKSAVVATEELADGYAFRVPGDEKLMMIVFELIAAERACCPFLTFELLAHPNMGPIDVRVSGPAGTKGFLETILFDEPRLGLPIKRLSLRGKFSQNGSFFPKSVILDRSDNRANHDTRPKEQSVGKRYANILETVGNTPVIKINKLAPAHVNLFVKDEAFNPLGSVKDRLALGVIEDAEKTGRLKPGQTVVEATSGNTGIGLAMVCAQKGYPLVLTMAETFSVERRKLMRFLGAKVVLTPAAGRGFGMVAKAIELAEAHGWFLTRQFENEANADMHSRTTAREIVEDFKGERLDYWVTGFGTGGTLKGVARVLAKERPETKIILCEPDVAAMVSSGIQQQRNSDGSPAAPHPAFQPHPLQGWSPDFVPKLVGDAMDMKLISQVLRVENADAMRWSRELARKEGIFVGISSGATFAAALRVSAEAPAGSTILCMLPDTGERYLSTPLFADISVDMTAEELEISRSTPSAWLVPAQ